MISDLAHHILALHGIAALAIVFAVPLLESSAFIGFLFPAEIAVLLGGVLAFQHRVSLAAVLAAAIAGAILGDSIGYAVGHRYGRRLLHGSIGRLVKHEHLDRGERYLAQRGAKAVFFGRFTAALRVMIPGLAGMAGMPYRTFALFNITGGVVWATETVLLGYLAGASWRRAEHLATRIGLALLALLVLGLGLTLLVRTLARRLDRLTALGNRATATAPAAWSSRHFPAQLAWVRRRLDPRSVTGLALSAVVTAAALGAWTFAGLTQDVVAHDEVVRLDPQVQAFALTHRTGWLTACMQAVTWLGSSVILVPVLLGASGLLLGRRRDWRTSVQLWAALGGAAVLYGSAKVLVDRARPPATQMITHATGWSYPSGHATQAIAVWGMLAFVLLPGRSARARTVLLTTAVIVVLLVGASRIYLGAHWFTDVLGGYALGGTWLGLLLALRLRGMAPATGKRRCGKPGAFATATPRRREPPYSLLHAGPSTGPRRR